MFQIALKDVATIHPYFKNKNKTMISKILFLFYFITSLTAHYDIDDTLLYKIDFQPFGHVKTSLDSVKGSMYKTECRIIYLN